MISLQPENAMTTSNGTHQRSPGPAGIFSAAVPANFGRTVVTGGVGFIGSHLVTRLARRGIETVVVDARKPASPISGVEYVVADLRAPDQSLSALHGADTVFHLAGTLDAPGSIRDPATDFESNVVTTLNVLRAAAAAAVRRFVFTSSALIYGSPPSCPVSEDATPQPVFPYAESKCACERLIASFGKAHQMSYVIGRTFVAYGPGEPPTARAEVSQYVRAMLAGASPHVLGDPDAKTRDFVHVFDVAEALMTLAAGPVTGIVNIGTGRETTLRELTEIAAAALRIPVPDLPWEPSPEDQYRLVADITRLRALGFEPSVSLEDGVAALAKDLSCRTRPLSEPARGAVPV
jgi:UDP-glucose 4-epimerase